MKKKRRLSQSEEALWRRAVRDVVPLRQKPPGVPLGEPPALPVGEPPFRPLGHPPAPPLEARRPGRPSAPASAFDSGDPALERKARRGRMTVERTLDLHGLTQNAARGRLAFFLQGAARDGCRLVLVVTGKGRAATYAASGADAAGRGVLRKRFFDWVEEPSLRLLINRVAPAAPKDGGAGAFYVFLKRARSSAQPETKAPR